MKSDITCIRGDTTAWNVLVVKDTIPVDLTAAQMWFTGLRGPGGTQIFQRTVGSGITIDPDQVGNTGKAVIKLANASTAGLAAEPVTLFYDVQVKTAAGDLWTVVYGDLVVTPDATGAIA